MNEILNIIHNTIYQFFDACEDDEEVPMSDKDKLLLEVNKAICNNLKAFNVTDINVWDLISRQAAKSKAVYSFERHEKVVPVAELDWLPSVEPEKCGDCISRQAVLDLAKRGRLVSNGNYKSVCDAINGLPSVEPERKTGHWIMIDEELQRYKCSECGEIIRIYGFNNKTLKDYRFSHCGAKMEVDV